jgi:hypothetical protein
MPELITPPRRVSVRAAMRSSSAGSNERAVRVIVTPAGVVKIVSTYGPFWLQVRPGDRRVIRKSDRRLRAVAQTELWSPPKRGATT